MWINHYEIIEHQSEKQGFLYAVAQRKSDLNHYLIKWPANPASASVEQLEHEWTLYTQIDEGFDALLFPYKKIQWGAVHALTYPLKHHFIHFLGDYLHKHKLSIEQGFSIAVDLVRALILLQEKGLRHRNLHPNAMLYDPISHKIKLGGLQFSSALLSETRQDHPDNEIPLNYISPEQTGRINRAMDYRSDLYSLGMSLYRIFTGQLAFKNTENLDICYQHIAQSVTSPQHINQKIPSVLAQIILKLLNKSPEKRYQNLYCLQSDLQHCQTQWQTYATIADFDIAQGDISSQFIIPENLYGREYELSKLQSAFKEICQTEQALQWFVVEGDAGVGKTALVKELQATINQSQAYFISGKFDQFQRHKPYHALLEAFKSLFSQILAEGSQKIQIWSKHITQHLGDNYQVLLAVLPELKYFINVKPIALSETQIQQRFQHSMQQLLHACCTGKYAVVLFLDDLQWIDNASFSLIKKLLTQQNLSKLLLISAHRSNEIMSHEPAKLIIEYLYHSNISINTLKLKPLNQDHVKQLLIDTLYYSALPQYEPLSHPASLEELAASIQIKTQGNPFYINAFLQQLYKQEAIYFDWKNSQWCWHQAQIEAFPLSDNVVDLMAKELKQLPKKNLSLITLAACIGNQFDLGLLSTVAEKDPRTVEGQLFTSLQQKLLIQRGNSYYFSHDRIQEAAYHLLSTAQKQQLHQTIGILLFKNTPDKQLENHIFTIANHLNCVTAFNHPSISPEQFARINCIAAEKAQLSAAYKTARNYFIAGINILEVQWGKAGMWDKYYSMSCQLYLGAANMHYLCLDLDRAEAFYNVLDEYTDNKQDQIKTYNLRCRHYTHQGQWALAVEQGFKSLSLCGFDIPENIEYFQVASKWNKIKSEHFSELLSLARLEKETTTRIDSNDKLLLDIFRNLISPLSVLSKPLLLFISLEIINYAIKKQFIQQAYLPLALCGGYLGELLGEYKEGYLLCKQVYDIVEDKDQVNEKGMINFIYALAAHWVKPIKESFPLYQQGHEYAVNEADLIFSSYCLGIMIAERLVQGHILSAIKIDILHYEKQIAPINKQVKYLLVVSKQYILNLEDKTAQGSQLESDYFNEKNILKKFKEKYASAAMVGFYLYRLELAVLYHEKETVMDMRTALDKIIKNMAGHLMIFEYHFFAALSYIQNMKIPLQENNSNDQESLRKHYQQLKKYAQYCPENFLHAKRLIQAEIARLSNNSSKAIDCYDQAILLAKENGFLQYYAIANEYAAQFWLSRNKCHIAEFYLNESYQSFKRWGAIRKIKLMKIDYSGFSLGISKKQTVEKNIHGQIELKTIIDSVQAIISQVELQDLVQETLQLVMKQTGASRTILFIYPQDSQHLLYSAILENGKIKLVDNNIQKQDYPYTIINSVKHRKKYLLLNNIQSNSDFNNDIYFQKQAIKSVFCLPLLDKKQLSGILYLENNVLDDAFQSQHKQLVQVLAAYAAVAINKSSTYQKLSLEIKQRKQAQQQLHQSLNKLEKIKKRLEAENTYLHEKSYLNHNFSEIIGQSDAIFAVLEKIELVAPTEANVLIIGESGTGKELMARAIHQRSRRKNSALISVNCGAIPKELFESEFFGHTKGAFTGAVSDRMGRFELADKATLFLDEVVEIPLPLQSKLLRVLQEGEFERVGDNKTYKVDVRIIAASNQCLETAVAQGAFRQDLYFRLCVFPLKIPPLRQRKTDIALLAQHFINIVAKKMSKTTMNLSQANVQTLEQYSWPGNVRELQNIIERAVIISQNNHLDIYLNSQENHNLLGNTPLLEQENSTHSDNKVKVLNETEMQQRYRKNIIYALQQTQGKIAGKDGAAALLGLKPSTLNSKIKSLNIQTYKRIIN